MPKYTPDSTQLAFSFDAIPYGYCHCGCGQKTNIAKYSDHRRGTKIGEPYDFRLNHRIPSNPDERFWSKVDKRGPDECWLWTASVTDTGYGKLLVNRKLTTASRLSYEIHNGPIPGGLWVLHKCDNPPCVNPAHLFLGTHQDNIDDMVSKDRNRTYKGENHKLAHFTNEQIKEIRRLYATGKYKQAELAQMSGAGKSTIQRIVHYETYTDV